MKFMDKVDTNLGQGAAVARTAEGELLASIPRDKVRGRICRGPCLNVIVKWCETKRIWCEGKGCEGCRLGEK